MLERLLITIGVVAVAVAGYWIYTQVHRRRASSVEAGATEGPRVLYFRSDHCTSCETQAELLAELDAEMRGIIEPVDVDAEPDRAQAYGVLTLPTTLVMDPSGEVQQINYGVTKPEKLRKQLAKVGAAA
jgi:thioredoxin 1